MAVLVLGYPDLEKHDLAWIEGIRAEHDELYRDVVGAHFTLVFPVSNLDAGQFTDHVRQTLEGASTISFVLRCAVIVKDSFNEYTHVFLVPDEGYSDLVKLHDRLYTDCLANQLRLDVPFIPHIGVGNSRDPRVCKRLADDLNGHGFEIAGRVSALDAVTFESSTVTTIARVPLG